MITALLADAVQLILLEPAMKIPNLVPVLAHRTRIEINRLHRLPGTCYKPCPDLPKRILSIWLEM